MRLTPRALVALAVAALMTGCSASNSPAASATPNSSAAAVEVCPQIDFRMPNGEPLDLTGQWLATSGGSYYMSQDESCLFWLGQSAPQEGVPAGTYWSNVFSGRIVSSFVVAGPWSDVPVVASASANHGQLTLGIDFFDMDGVTWPALAMLSQEPVDVFGDWAWQPEASVSEFDTFIGTVGIDGGFCPWLDVDGQRYALLGDVYVEGQHIFGKDGRGFMAGDEVGVEGRITTSFSHPSCESTAQLVVRDLYSAP